jgi:hypothetical protein
MRAQGYLDTRQMAGAFGMLRSNDLIWSRLIRQYLLGEREHPSDLTAWNADGTRMPAGAYALGVFASPVSGQRRRFPWETSMFLCSQWALRRTTSRPGARSISYICKTMVI